MTIGVQRSKIAPNQPVDGGYESGSRQAATRTRDSVIPSNTTGQMASATSGGMIITALSGFSSVSRHRNLGVPPSARVLPKGAAHEGMLPTRSV